MLEFMKNRFLYYSKGYLDLGFGDDRFIEKVSKDSNWFQMN